MGMPNLKIRSTNHFAIDRFSTLISYIFVINKQSFFYKCWIFAATDRRVEVRWFPDVSGAEPRHHLACGLVEPQLMTSSPAPVVWSCIRQGCRLECDPLVSERSQGVIAPGHSTVWQLVISCGSTKAPARWRRCSAAETSVNLRIL